MALSKVQTRLAQCKLLAFDFDGVFTDNKVYVNEQGEEMIRADRSDTFGLDQLQQTGVEVLIISSEPNEVVLHRAKKLGIPAINNVDDKGATLTVELKKRKLKSSQTIYVGNDSNDLPALKIAGFSIAVADAYPPVRQQADYVTKATGGNGAVREVISLVLKAKQKVPIGTSVASSKRK